MTTEVPEFGEAIGLRSNMLREHPALLFTLVYFIASTIGMLFSWALYRDFDINVFAYAEVTDFLMAALREPLTFAVASGSVAIAWGIWWLTQWEQRIFARRPPKNWFARMYAAQSSWVARSRWTVVLVVAIYAVTFLALYAEKKGDQIRGGIGKQVVIIQEGTTASPPMMLLGTTSRLVFVFNRDTELVSILPYESIVRIDVVAEAPPPVVAPEPDTPQVETKPDA